MIFRVAAYYFLITVIIAKFFNQVICQVLDSIWEFVERVLQGYLSSRDSGISSSEASNRQHARNNSNDESNFEEARTSTGVTAEGIIYRNSDIPKKSREMSRSSKHVDRKYHDRKKSSGLTKIYHGNSNGIACKVKNDKVILTFKFTDDSNYSSSSADTEADSSHSDESALNKQNARELRAVRSNSIIPRVSMHNTTGSTEESKENRSKLQSETSICDIEKASNKSKIKEHVMKSSMHTSPETNLDLISSDKSNSTKKEYFTNSLSINSAPSKKEISTKYKLCGSSDETENSSDEFESMILRGENCRESSSLEIQRNTLSKSLQDPFLPQVLQNLSKSLIEKKDFGEMSNEISQQESVLVKSSDCISPDSITLMKLIKDITYDADEMFKSRIENDLLKENSMKLSQKISLSEDSEHTNDALIENDVFGTSRNIYNRMKSIKIVPENETVVEPTKMDKNVSHKNYGDMELQEKSFEEIRNLGYESEDHFTADLNVSIEKVIPENIESEKSVVPKRVGTPPNRGNFSDETFAEVDREIHSVKGIVPEKLARNINLEHVPPKVESKIDSKELVSESLNGIRPELVTSATHKIISPCSDAPYATDQKVVSIEIPSGTKIKRDESPYKDASEDIVSSHNFKDKPEENNRQKYTSDDDASNMSSSVETLVETFDLESYLMYITELSNKVKIKNDIERETLTKLLEVIKISLEKYSPNDNIVNTPKHSVSGTSLQRSSELSFKECPIGKDSISEMENILYKTSDINESRNSVSNHKDSLEGNSHNTQLKTDDSELTSLKSNIKDDIKQTMGGVVSVGKASDLANNVTSNQKSISRENTLEDNCTPVNITSQNDTSDEKHQDISYYKNIPENSHQETNMENASTEISASTVTRTEDLKTSSEDAYHSANKKSKEVQPKVDGIQEFKHLIAEGNGIKNITAEENYIQIEVTDGELIDKDEESISFDLKQDDGNDKLNEYIQQFYSDYADNETDPAVKEYVQNCMKKPIHHKYESTCTEAHGNSSESIPTTFKTHSKSKQRNKQKKSKTSSGPNEDNVSENVSACHFKETEDSHFPPSKENSEAPNESINVSAEGNFSNKQNNGLNNRSGVENVSQSQQDVVPRVTDTEAHGTSFNDMRLVPVCESNDTKKNSIQFYLQLPHDMKMNGKALAIKVTDVPLEDHEFETKNSTSDVPYREYSEKSAENISKDVCISNTSQTGCRTTQEGDLDAKALKGREILPESAVEIQTMGQQVAQSVKGSVEDLNKECISEEIKQNELPLQTKIENLIAQKLKEDKEYAQCVAEINSESTWEFINRKKNRKTIDDSEKKHWEISNNKDNLEKSNKETNIAKASRKTSGSTVARTEVVKKSSKSATFKKPKEVQQNVDEYQVLKDLAKQSNGIIPIKDVRENYIRIVEVNKNEENINFDTSENDEYQKLDDYRQQFYSEYADSETDAALAEYVQFRIKTPIQHSYEPMCTEAHGDSSDESLSATSKTQAKSKKRHKLKKTKSSACNEDNKAENISTGHFKETDDSNTNQRSGALDLSIKKVCTECMFSNNPSKPNDVLNNRYGAGDVLQPQDVVSIVTDDTAQETSFINSRFEPVCKSDLAKMKNLGKNPINSTEKVSRLSDDITVEEKELKSLENIGESSRNEMKTLGKKEDIQIPEQIYEDECTSKSLQTDSKTTQYIKHSTESGVVVKDISKEQEGDSDSTTLKSHEKLRESAMVIQTLGQKIAQSVKRSVKDLNKDYISEEIKRNQQPLQLKIDNLIAQRLKEDEEYFEDAGKSMDYATDDTNDEPRWKFVNRKIYRKTKNTGDDQY